MNTSHRHPAALSPIISHAFKSAIFPLIFMLAFCRIAAAEEAKVPANRYRPPDGRHPEDERLPLDTQLTILTRQSTIKQSKRNMFSSEVNPDEFPPETVALAMSGEDANTYQFVYVLAPSRPSGGGEALALGEALQRRAIQAERARAEAEGYVRTLEERLSETEQRLEGVQKSETEARERLDARERELREQAGAREHELREQLETIERELRDRLAEVDRLHEAVRYAKLDIAVKDEQLASLQAELAPLRRRLDRAEELLSYARHRLVERASKTTKRIPLVHRRLKRLVEGIGTRYR